MKVLDMEANAGYSTELIARAVGPTGVVYAQDPASIIERFVKDNHLRIVDERSADCVIRGKITTYKNAVFGFSAANRAQEYRVTIGCSVVFKDLVKNREIWNAPDLVKTSNYFVVDVPGQAAQTELDGRKEAIAKIADEILSRSVEGW